MTGSDGSRSVTGTRADRGATAGSMAAGASGGGLQHQAVLTSAALVGVATGLTLQQWWVGRRRKRQRVSRCG